MEKEVKELKDSDKIKEEYSRVCSNLGDLMFHVEQNKRAQLQLQMKYEQAVKKEQEPEKLIVEPGAAQ